jgi:hypothetical protein
MNISSFWRFSGVSFWRYKETLEITHGFSDWFELGFYVFTSADSRVGWQWVGDHIRPRVAVPESWKWPVGVSFVDGVRLPKRANAGFE